MLDLYNIKYDRKTLKNNIYAVNLTDILKTQILDITFIVRYILNDLYQLNVFLCMHGTHTMELILILNLTYNKIIFA